MIKLWHNNSCMKVLKLWKKQQTVDREKNKNETLKSRSHAKKATIRNQKSTLGVNTKSRNGQGGCTPKKCKIFQILLSKTISFVCVLFFDKNKVSKILYNVILSVLIIYLFLFIFQSTALSTCLIFFLLPLTVLFLSTGYAYISPKSFLLPQYVAIRNKAFYFFLLFILISLNFFPFSSTNLKMNSFSFFPEKTLSIYNVYINYTLITGFLILAIPDIRDQSINWYYWQNNPFYKSIFSKIFFFVVLPTPLFISFSFQIYKYELKEDINVLLQVVLIGCICMMLTYLFIVLKNIIFEILIIFTNRLLKEVNHVWNTKYCWWRSKKV